MKRNLITTILLCMSVMSNARTFDFNNTNLGNNPRVSMLVSQLTLDEKIHLLSSDLSVERLVIPHCGQDEGLHGLTLGGPGRWGLHNTLPDGTKTYRSFPTTCFPQEYGMGETWDPELISLIGDQ